MADPSQTPSEKDLSPGSQSVDDNTTAPTTPTTPATPAYIGLRVQTLSPKSEPTPTKPAGCVGDSYGPVAISHGLAQDPDRYNPACGPNGTPAPKAYSAQAITEAVERLAELVGMSTPKAIKHPYEIIDWVLDHGDDKVIAARIVSMAGALEQKYLSLDLLAEYADVGLRNHPTFQRILETFKNVRLAVKPISDRVEHVKKARVRMDGNIVRLRAYMGAAYFDHYYLEDMTPSLADKTLSAIKKAYGENIPWADAHRGIDQARRDRLVETKKGVRSSLDLQPSDVVSWLTGNYSKEEVSPDDIKSINGKNDRRQVTLKGSSSLVLDPNGLLHKSLSADDAPRIGGDETIYGKNGLPSKRETVQKAVNNSIATERGRKSRSSETATTIRVAPGRAVAPRRSLQRVGSDGGLSRGIETTPGAKEDAAAVLSEAEGQMEEQADSDVEEEAATTQELKREEAAAESEEHTHDSSPVRSTQPNEQEEAERIGRRGTGLLDITNGLEKRSRKGVRPQMETWEQIFTSGPREDKSASRSTPVSGGDVTKYLLYSPNPLENQLVQFILDGYNYMGGQATTPGQMPSELKNAEQAAVLRAATHLIGAVEEGTLEKGVHPVMHGPGWLPAAFHAIGVMKRTLQLVEARQDPPWIAECRALIQQTQSRFTPEQQKVHQVIAYSVGEGEREKRSRAIRLRPDQLKEENYFISEIHKGRYRGRLSSEDVTVAVQFLTRNDRLAQVIESGPCDELTKFASAMKMRKQVPGYRLHLASTKEFPILYIPKLIDGNHWILLILDCSHQRYEILNSIKAEVYDELAREQVSTIVQYGLKADFTEWTEGKLSSQQQTNGADCGFWVAANAAAYAYKSRAAGKQETEDLRRWLIRILCDALDAALPVGGNNSRPTVRWVNEKQESCNMDTNMEDADPSTKTPRKSKTAGRGKSMQDIENDQHANADATMADAVMQKDIKTLEVAMMDGVVDDETEPIGSAVTATAHPAGRKRIPNRAKIVPGTPTQPKRKRGDDNFALTSSDEQASGKKARRRLRLKGDPASKRSVVKQPGDKS